MQSIQWYPIAFGYWELYQAQSAVVNRIASQKMLPKIEGLFKRLMTADGLTFAMKSEYFQDNA
jgi:hypothetical protein